MVDLSFLNEEIYCDAEGLVVLCKHRAGLLSLYGCSTFCALCFDAGASMAELD